MRSWIVGVVVGGLLVAGASSASAQAGSATITGRVVDERGAGVAGVTVIAEGGAERGVVTDSRGGYEIGPLPAGRYTLRVQGIGYRGDEVQVDARGAVTVELAVTAAPVALEGLRVLSATRTGTAAATLPVKVEVIEEQEMLVQQTMATNPTEVLSNLIPSFSPARQKLSTAGESFRGRRPLFLIDGVPQSNPLRDGRRDGFTIDMEAIERVEVIFGANAIQGLGATGGIVNYVTVSAPETGELAQRASVSTTSSGELEDEGFGWRGHYLAAKRVGDFDLLGSFSYEQRGLQYDADGRAIGIDNVQGDVADSHSRNLLVKLGWRPAAGQRLQVMVNDFELAQEGDFDLVPGDRAAGIPAISVPGQPEGVEPINDVTTASLDYEHANLFGGTFSAKAYVQDFSSLFGGGRFDTFQDPLIAPVGTLFDQSENNSEKFGTRLTFARSAVADAPVDVIAGFDFLRDRTFQRLVQTDRNWVPTTNFINYAPFAQVDVRPVEWLSVSGGLRWELAELDVPDFTTLAGNRADHRRLEVTGGSPSFDEPLLNVGAVVTPVDGLRFYGTLSQAFTMPDVGRVLRGVSEEGTAVEDFLSLDPIKTDNVEVGGTYGTGRALVGVTYFESKSELGSRLVPNSDGIFQVRREPVQTSGWELTSRAAPIDGLTVGAGYSRLEGRFDGDNDGRLESDLSAADIGPDRLNLSADIRPAGRFSGRVQSFTYFDRVFRDGAGQATAEFDGYTTVDAAVSAAFGISTVTLSVSNLLDEQYITYFGQAGTTLADRYFAGRGRSLTARVEARF